MHDGRSAVLARSGAAVLLGTGVGRVGNTGIRLDLANRATVIDSAGKAVACVRLGEKRLELFRLLPDVLVVALPGRRLSELLDLTGLITMPHTIITGAHQIPGSEASSVKMAFGRIEFAARPGATMITVADAFQAFEGS